MCLGCPGTAGGAKGLTLGTGRCRHIASAGEGTGARAAVEPRQAGPAKRQWSLQLCAGALDGPSWEGLLEPAGTFCLRTGESMLLEQEERTRDLREQLAWRWRHSPKLSAPSAQVCLSARVLESLRQGRLRSCGSRSEEDLSGLTGSRPSAWQDPVEQ